MMINRCFGCGKDLVTNLETDRKSARFICEDCYAKSKEATVTYKILYKNGVEDKIIQAANDDEIKAVNDLIMRAFQEGDTGVLTLCNSNREGFIIRIDDVSRVSIYKGVS